MVRVGTFPWNLFFVLFGHDKYVFASRYVLRIPGGDSALLLQEKQQLKAYRLNWLRERSGGLGLLGAPPSRCP